MRGTRQVRWFVRAAVVVALLAGAGGDARARGDVTLDAESLNRLLSVMTPRKIDVPLFQGARVTLELDDLRVNGFAAAEGGADGRGYILTSLRLRIPELGLETPLEPRLSIHIRERRGATSCQLRFDQVRITLAGGASVDVAPLLPALPLLTDTAWIVESAGGPVRVRTRLVDARTGVKALRLSFEVEAEPAR